MLAAYLTTIERLLVSMIRADHSPPGPSAQQDDHQADGAQETAASDDNTLPYWSDDDDGREYNTLVREDAEICLGMLIKVKGELIQVCDIGQDRLGINYSCKHRDRARFIRKIRLLRDEIYRSNPSIIRNYTIPIPGTAQSDGSGYHPRNRRYER